MIALLFLLMTSMLSLQSTAAQHNDSDSGTAETKDEFFVTSKSIYDRLRDYWVQDSASLIDTDQTASIDFDNVLRDDDKRDVRSWIDKIFAYLMG